jgi:hypothetical protein
MKFYISFKDSKENTFKTISIWASEIGIESLLKDFVTNNFNVNFIESMNYEENESGFELSLVGQNEMTIGSIMAEAA